DVLQILYGYADDPGNLEYTIAAIRCVGNKAKVRLRSLAVIQAMRFAAPHTIPKLYASTVLNPQIRLRFTCKDNTYSAWSTGNQTNYDSVPASKLFGNYNNLNTVLKLRYKRYADWLVRAIIIDRDKEAFSFWGTDVDPARILSYHFLSRLVWSAHR